MAACYDNDVSEVTAPHVFCFGSDNDNLKSHKYVCITTR